MVKVVHLYFKALCQSQKFSMFVKTSCKFEDDLSPVANLQGFKDMVEIFGPRRFGDIMGFLK